MNKTIIVLLASTFLALSLGACSSAANSGSSQQTTDDSASQSDTAQATQEDTTSAQPASAEIGEIISVHSSKGDYDLTVDGFELNSGLREKYAYDTSFNDSDTIGVLYLTVENVSYSDPYNGDYVILSPDVYLEDQDGVTINPESSGYDVGQYAVGAAASFTCGVGQTVRVAVPYVVEASIPSVTVVTPDAEVSIDEASFGAPTGSSALAAAASSASGKATANMGDEIIVSTSIGDYALVVDGFETSTDIRNRYDYFGELDDDETIGILLMTVRNDSYDDPYNDGYLSLDQAVYVVDPSGVTLHPESSAYDYGRYEGGSLFYNIQIGQTKRVAAFYLIPNDTGSVTVVVGDHAVDVPVTAA